ncbi:MAG: helix-hairpin-helix domain-containing protein [Betaproteobacteria bacterium]|nr:helix-hairpin-helix domain-containing protein [Betaproteobacteria bacterium]
MRSLATILLVVSLGVSAPTFAVGNAPPASKAPSTKPAAGPQTDINSASADELMMLDGIGEARAKAIIKGRPYGRKDELAKRNIIPDAVYEKIKDRLIAKQK